MHQNEVNSLLVKIQDGDNRAFEDLYKQTSRGVYSFVYSFMNNHMDTEDVLQLTYMKIKQNIGYYRPGSNGVAWILEIAKNTALNEIRSKKKNQDICKDLAANYIQPSTNNDNDKSILNIIKKVLREEEQQILILHVIWNYRHKDIAQFLNLPLGTVTSKYKRSIAKVKSKWKEEVK